MIFIILKDSKQILGGEIYVFFEVISAYIEYNP